MIKVNVIITCYNKENTITRAIESVKRQTLTDFNCIIVDDGSTDNSRQVVLQDIKDDDRFSYLRIKNAGVANARNTGIAQGQAPFVTCLDGDDGLEPEFLETCYNAISKDHTLGIVYTDVLLAHIDSYFTVARWPEADESQQFEGFNQVPCCNMFRRDVFERLGGYRQRYAPKGAGAEDAELWLRFFKLGYKAKKITNEPLFVYNAFGGLTQNNQYKEVDWLGWHTTKPFASLEEPNNGYAHPITQRGNPLVSIIVPVGPGHEHYLVDALDSIEAQTFANWEAIVIFDKQIPDNLESIQKAYPYVKYILHPKFKNSHHGAGAARNLGASVAKGKYITFLDADDYLQPKFLELTLKAIHHFNADWIYTDVWTQVIFNRDHYHKKVTDLTQQGLDYSIIDERESYTEFMYEYQCDEWSIDSLYRDGLAGVTCLYRKSDFDAVDGFDIKNNREDWDFHLRLAKAGKCGLRLPIPLFTYRLQSGKRREYKEVTNDWKLAKQYKQADIDRLHKNYNQEELKMGCTSCKKQKIEIESVPETQKDTLVYIGGLRGGVLRGKATGKSYPVQRASNGKFILSKVHPQDAQIFVQGGLCQYLQAPKRQRQTVQSPTPKQVDVQEKLSHGDIVKRTNEFAKKAADEARKATEAFFNRPKQPPIDPKPTNDLWYTQPETYHTISHLRDVVNAHETTQQIIDQMIQYEQQNKNRKGAISFLESL